MPYLKKIISLKKQEVISKEESHAWTNGTHFDNGTNMKRKDILICWIGVTDLRASLGEIHTSGPIAQVIESEPFAEIHLLYNYRDRERKKQCRAYREWLQTKTSGRISLHEAPLTSPTDYSAIYLRAEEFVRTCIQGRENRVHITFHLSPGTPAMATVWIVLGKVNVKALTGLPARLLQSSAEEGIAEADIPFDLAVFRHAIKEACAFSLPEDFIAHDKAMLEVIDRLRRVAPWDNIRVLITGETGTGKERFVALLHEWIEKFEGNKRPFIAFNCAAVPDSLVESELFGAVKGAATGIDQDRQGLFEVANGGTLFMDEIGELSLEAQAKILRVIQEKKITKVGDTREKEIDVRLITATHRDLVHEVAAGGFREDLFYRIAEAVIYIPPLRERRDDILPLAEAQLKELNQVGVGKIPEYRPKIFHQEAEKLLLRYDWPGNVRELQLVVKQAAIWTERDIITAQNLRRYMSRTASRQSMDAHPLLPSIDKPLALEEVLEKIKKEYITRTYRKTGNQAATASWLGYPSRGSIRKYLSRQVLYRNGDNEE